LRWPHERFRSRLRLGFGTVSENRSGIDDEARRKLSGEMFDPGVVAVTMRFAFHRQLSKRIMPDWIPRITLARMECRRRGGLGRGA